MFRPLQFLGKKFDFDVNETILESNEAELRQLKKASHFLSAIFFAMGTVGAVGLTHPNIGVSISANGTVARVAERSIELLIEVPEWGALVVAGFALAEQRQISHDITDQLSLLTAETEM